MTKRNRGGRPPRNAYIVKPMSGKWGTVNGVGPIVDYVELGYPVVVAVYRPHIHRLRASLFTTARRRGLHIGTNWRQMNTNDGSDDANFGHMLVSQ